MTVILFMQIVTEQKIDYRTIPKIMVCGRGTAAEFAEHGIRVDAQPESGFSAKGLFELAKKIVQSGEAYPPPSSPP